MKQSTESKTDFGTYDEKGYWQPPYPCTFSPLFTRPADLRAILKYLFGWGGYLRPRNAFYVGLAAVTWFFLQAGPETTAQLGVGWIGFVLLRNIALMWFIFGTYHLLYFSVVLIHFVVPSHPIHFFFDSQLTALTPAGGHDGFEGPLLRGFFPVGDYFHYLHHRFVSCNFGTATVPWDRWLVKFYNGEGPYRTRHAAKEA